MALMEESFFWSKSCFLVTVLPTNIVLLQRLFTTWWVFNILPVANFMSPSKLQKSSKSCSVTVFTTGVRDRVKSYQFCATPSGWQQLLFWKYQSDFISVTLVDQGIPFIPFSNQSSWGSNHYVMKWNWPKTRFKQLLLTLQPMVLIIVTAIICWRKSHYTSFVFLLIIIAHH